MSFWDYILANLIYFEAVIVSVVAIVLERTSTRYLKRISKRMEWPPHLVNGFLLIFRLLIFLGALAMLMRIGGVPPDWLVAYTALGGAAIGFASTRTLGNFFAGLFVFVTRPFQVNDYVRVDDLEGIVEEITFNYTKILTSNSNLIFISNLSILDKNIVNYRYSYGKSTLYCYPIVLSFDHSISTNRLEKIFSMVADQYAKTLPRKPEYFQLRIEATGRVYSFSLYVKEPKDIFSLRSAIVKEITEEWDNARGNN